MEGREERAPSSRASLTRRLILAGVLALLLAFAWPTWVVPYAITHWLEPRTAIQLHVWLGKRNTGPWGESLMVIEYPHAYAYLSPGPNGRWDTEFGSIMTGGTRWKGDDLGGTLSPWDESVPPGAIGFALLGTAFAWGGSLLLWFGILAWCPVSTKGRLRSWGGGLLLSFTLAGAVCATAAFDLSLSRAWDRFEFAGGGEPAKSVAGYERYQVRGTVWVLALLAAFGGAHLHANAASRNPVEASA